MKGRWVVVLDVAPLHYFQGLAEQWLVDRQYSAALRLREIADSAGHNWHWVGVFQWRVDDCVEACSRSGQKLSLKPKIACSESGQTACERAVLLHLVSGQWQATDKRSVYLLQV